MAATVKQQQQHDLEVERELTRLEAEEPSSLGSDSSGNSSLPSSSANDSERGAELKCSAVHTLERDMPDFDYSAQVAELRALIVDELERLPGLYTREEADKCRHDDWHLARFLLRNHLNVGQAFEMLRAAMRYQAESLTCSLRPEDYPAEFYQLGGIFTYEPDRKGNRMLYLRVALHRHTAQILTIIQAFVYYNIRRADSEANGRGIAIVLDCSNAGLANADLDLLLYLIGTLKSYFPKGLSYFLVHQLPWILKPFWHLARPLIPEEHRQLIKFSNSQSVFEYVLKENLPDFMGGTCKRDYRQLPENCTRLEEAAKLWGIDHHTLRKVLPKFQDHLPAETMQRLNAYMDECEARECEGERNE